MRKGRLGLAVIAPLAALLAGCGVALVVPGVTPSATGPRPPLAADLTDGTPLDLGSAGHWAVGAGRAFVATADGAVAALDLATGATAWRTSFARGEPWDAQPTLGLSEDGATVVGLRTVDAGGGAALDLLLLDAASGTPREEYLLTDPAGEWTIDLPPRVLAADDATIVLADNPEWGRQTAVVEVAGGRLAWRVDDQAVAATSDTVVTRGGGWSRADGTHRWTAAAGLGPLLAQSPDAVVARTGPSGSWLDPRTGTEFATTGVLDEVEPPCAATRDTLVCLGSEVTGYDLPSAERLWNSPEQAEAVAAVGDWVYLWREDGRGDVLDARTGQAVILDAELPSVRYSDAEGALFATDHGSAWVRFVR